jgi:hypothetical protein
VPRDLDPLPQEKPPGKKLIAHEVLKSQEPVRATFREYEALVEDHPEKLSAEEVDYRDAEGEEKCKLCFHFFTQGGGDRRTVCEIFRPTGEDENVDPNYVCRFFTEDMEEYPLLENENKKGKKSSSSPTNGEE